LVCSPSSATRSRNARTILVSEWRLAGKKSDVLRLVMRQGTTLSLMGVVIGVVVALGVTRFLSNLLYGVKPTDPLTFIAVSLILIAVALLASCIPARRATKVDPMVALRCE
jgi:putative ABC transport system permease protein